jgi:hypothetical protein
MPKGERRSNREVRKPKAEKPKSGPRPPSFQSAAIGSTMGTGGGKKK